MTGDIGNVTVAGSSHGRLVEFGRRWDSMSHESKYDDVTVFFGYILAIPGAIFERLSCHGRLVEFGRRWDSMSHGSKSDDVTVFFESLLSPWATPTGTPLVQILTQNLLRYYDVSLTV